MTLSIDPSIVLPGHTANILGFLGNPQCTAPPVLHDANKQIVQANSTVRAAYTIPGYGQVPAGRNVTFLFCPDVGGVYVLKDSAGSLTVDVPSQVSYRLLGGLSVGSTFIDVVAYVQGNTIISTSIAMHGEDSPRLQAPQKLGQNIVNGIQPVAGAYYASLVGALDSRVLSALRALVGMTSAQVVATGLPNLQSAFKAALASPVPAQSENLGEITLASNGWSVS